MIQNGRTSRAGTIAWTIVVVLLLMFVIDNRGSSTKQSEREYAVEARTVGQAMRGENGSEDPLAYLALSDVQVLGLPIEPDPAALESAASNVTELLQSSSRVVISGVASLVGSLFD